LEAGKNSNPKLFDPAAGVWWRFEQYELRDGHIRPAKGARLERWDPWEEYRAARESRPEGQPPYQRLLQLVNSIPYQPATARAEPVLAPSSEQSILDWCRQYGLLGILPQRVLQVNVGPRDEPLSDEMKALINHRQDRWPRSMYRYVRTCLGWSQHEIVEPYPAGNASAAEGLGTQHQSYALIQRLEDFDWVQEPLTRTWARYFPDVPVDQRETHLYPRPNTKEFWDEYSEPVGDFLEHAASLAHAIRFAGVRPLHSQHLPQPLVMLNQFAQSVSLALTRKRGGTFEQRWGAPSLLASLAAMAIQDRAACRPILCCHGCGAAFVVAAHQWQAKFCSARCRHRIQKQRQRAAKQL
jgi:hypothetical protein